MPGKGGNNEEHIPQARVLSQSLGASSGSTAIACCWRYIYATCRTSRYSRPIAMTCAAASWLTFSGATREAEEAADSPIKPNAYSSPGEVQHATMIPSMRTTLTNERPASMMRCGLGPVAPGGMWYDAGRGHSPLLRLSQGDVRLPDRHRGSWRLRWRAPALSHLSSPVCIIPCTRM